VKLNLPPPGCGKCNCREASDHLQCDFCSGVDRDKEIAAALREWVEMQMKLVGETERGPIMLLIEEFAAEIDPGKKEANDGRQEE